VWAGWRTSPRRWTSHARRGAHSARPASIPSTPIQRHLIALEAVGADDADALAVAHELTGSAHSGLLIGENLTSQYARLVSAAGAA
jgi:hypothetical protein